MVGRKRNVGYMPEEALGERAGGLWPSVAPAAADVCGPNHHFVTIGLVAQVKAGARCNTRLLALRLSRPPAPAGAWLRSAAAVQLFSNFFETTFALAN